MGKDIKTQAKTTRTSLEIVAALRDLDGSTIDELSEYLGYSPSTIHRHLVTLREEGFVVQQRKTYQVGLKFLTFGGYAQRSITAYPMIKEKVDYLAEETGERAQFIVEEHGKRIYLYTEVGESAVQTGAHVGKRGALHASAGGKAILSELSEDRIKGIISEHGLSKTGRNTITSESELFEELETIQERGYAFNRQETTDGVHAIGAAVTDVNDEVLGALSVSGPAHRLKGDHLTEIFPERILGAVNELELHIQHSV